MLKENVHVHDSLMMNGHEMHSDRSADIIGEVQVIYESAIDGKRIFTKNIYHNDLLVTGAVFLSEKANNMRSTFKTVPLDLELGIHRAEDIVVDHTTINSEKICGLMVGNEGAGDTYNTIYKIYRASRHVPGMIPFRVVPVDSDLEATERSKYFMRKIDGNYIYYYGKKFDIDREIHVEYEDGTLVPTDADVSVVNKMVRTFTRYRCTIDQQDIREYFKITQGSTLRSLINSVGLITGYPGTAADRYEEFYNVRGLTAFNMENQELKDSEATITLIYSLFIQ